MNQILIYLIITIFLLLNCKNSTERMICKENCQRQYPCLDVSVMDYGKGDECTPEKQKSDTKKRESCYDSCGGFQVPFH